MNKRHASILMLISMIVGIFPLEESDDTKFEYQLEEFLRNEFDYSEYLNSRSEIPTIPFRDVSTDTFWKFGSVEKSKLRRYVENNVTRELRALELKPWLSKEDILDELARCIHFKYGTTNKQNFVYDKQLSRMNLVKFSCLLIDDRYVFGMFLARFRFRLKKVLLRKQSWASNTRLITVRDMQKMSEHFWGVFATKSHDFVQKEIRKLNFRSESAAHDEENDYGKTQNSLDLTNVHMFSHASSDVNDLSAPEVPEYVVPEEVRLALINLYPEKDMMELTQNPKRDQYFRNVSIPMTIRLFRLEEREIPNALDIFWKDLSAESQGSLETCISHLCEESDQVSQLTEFNGSRPSEFFKDRALRYNISPDEALITYASSRPTFFANSAPAGSNATKFRKQKKLMANQTESEWYRLLDWQVAHNFRVNVPVMFAS
ncbi:hypothetical protein L596_004219 [Steinernema carpocapsae]|uniref:Uncharacterized protein n=1 Tax=Steinernema carpocapsae TaxID=34508 RepID=A0A4U8UW48_STECR|nr:hypothetical protein L596_004219 [Steinernema carpocapsae]